MSKKTAAKMVKSALSWGLDWVIDHWPTLLAFIVGGGGMSYLASATTWVMAWGPIVIGAAFFAGAYLAAGVYAIFVSISSRRVQNQFAEQALQKSSVSPLEESYQKQRVMIADFYNPYYVSYKNKRFQSCQVWGPAQIVMVGNVLVTGCTFKHCQVVVARDDATLFGAVGFEHISFIDCEMANLTLVMPRGVYNNIVAAQPDFAKYIPVVNAL